MSNSSLVSYTNISPNKNSPRNHAIDTITIHCMAGQMTAKACCDMFKSSSLQTSCNYAIGYDGKIGLCVAETDRSWCTCSYANDHRAVTIEVASDAKAPYAVRDAAMTSLLNLVTDICKRNNIKKLVWSTNKNDRVNHLNGCNMTVHKDYANKACPGDYLYNRMGWIAIEVNKRLTETQTPATPTTPAATAQETVLNTTVSKLNLTNVALYASSVTTTVSSYKTGTYYLWDKKVVNGRVRITNSTANIGRVGQVTGWVSLKDIRTQVIGSFTVKIITDGLTIRSGPSTGYSSVGKIQDNGIYTIVETKGTVGNSNSWGRLKSGAGWINLYSGYAKIV